MGHVENGFHIDVVHPVKFGFGHFQHGPIQVGNACIIDNDIRYAKGLDGVVHQSLNAVGNGNITSECTGVAAKSISHRFGRIAANIGNDDLGTFLHIQLRYTFTKTATCAGHDGNVIA